MKDDAPMKKFMLKPLIVALPHQRDVPRQRDVRIDVPHQRDVRRRRDVHPQSALQTDVHLQRGVRHKNVATRKTTEDIKLNK